MSRAARLLARNRARARTPSEPRRVLVIPPDCGYYIEQLPLLNRPERKRAMRALWFKPIKWTVQHITYTPETAP